MKTKYPTLLAAAVLCACGAGDLSRADDAAATTAPPPKSNERATPPEMAALKPHESLRAEDSDRAGGGWFVPANSPLKRFYGGVSAGPVFTDYSDTVDDGSVFGVDKGDIGVGLGVFLGYNLNDYLGLEASYTALEAVDFSATSDGSSYSWSAGAVSAEMEADLFALVLVGRYPLTPRWTIIGKIGFLHWETVETFVENGFVSTDKDNGSSVMVAGGFEYDLGVEKRFKLRGELGYQRFNSENLDMIGTTLGFVYEFP